MLDSTLSQYLRDSNKFDISFNFKRDCSNGDKISIQGKSLSDVITLKNMLFDYLTDNEISFKIATLKRVSHKDSEQSRKVFTIYVPNDINVMELCEEIYKRTITYKGWYDIKTPTSYKHYGGGLYYRNDRDNNGNYIKAN